MKTALLTVKLGNTGIKQAYTTITIDDDFCKGRYTSVRYL